jgi:hypothetical protein
LEAAMLERHVDWIERNALIDELMGFELGHINNKTLRQALLIIREGCLNTLSELPQDKLMATWKDCAQASEVIEHLFKRGGIAPHNSNLIGRMNRLLNRMYEHLTAQNA